VIINKFRGDMSLFDEGVRIIEESFGIPVLGVLPYVPFNLGFEDSQSLRNYTQDCSRATRRVAVIAYPSMSNYTDFEPLLADPNTCVTFVTTHRDLSGYDAVILPGSKLVMEDLAWLKSTGLADQIQALHRTAKTHITGICGGYQMLHQRLRDPEAIETAEPTEVEGLGLIEGEILFRREKTLTKHGARYEIHHGISTTHPGDYTTPTLHGTFSHGLYTDEAFERYEREQIEGFVAQMRGYIDVERIVGGI
jgi:adenosylcobyric acid synthase